MAIFNSLGSNYSLSDICRQFFSIAPSDASTKLRKVLGVHYAGQAILTYKGREALEIALTSLGLTKGSAVGINGFTCYAVYRAVENAGLVALPIDITESEFNFGVKELKAVHDKHPELKVIIVQNTFGFAADMAELNRYAREKHFVVIEDLAHSTGLVYVDGQEAGKVGDFTMLSFSQDKPLDVVAGGALIDRRTSTKTPSDMPIIGFRQRINNRFYPFWTNLIRGTYDIGLGRYLHFGLKKLKLMATPMSDDLNGLHRMSPSAVTWLLKRWPTLADELAHRRAIAAIYEEQLPSDLRLAKPASAQPTYLRYPIHVDRPDSLIEFLTQNHIYVGDTWYDAPIGPKKYLAQTNYKSGSCPNAEDLVKHILNLPTHRHVTPEIATDICVKIKLWQASQQK